MDKQKVLIAYFSASGNTKFIAETMAASIGADLLALTPKKQMNLSGAGYLGWGLRQLISKEDRELEPTGIRVADYDLIIVGTPVWTYTLTPPVRTFLKENTFAGKNVAVFCCHDGDKAHTLDDLKAGMPGSTCIGEIDFMSVLKQDKNQAAEKTRGWAAWLINQLTEKQT